MGLPLPSWCSEQDFQKLHELTAIAWDSMVHTREQKRIAAGPIIEQFLQAMDKKEDKTKIYLYSAHDKHVSIFNRVHNFTNYPAIPDFGCAILIETLRGQDNETYIRVSLNIIIK